MTSDNQNSINGRNRVIKIILLVGLMVFLLLLPFIISSPYYLHILSLTFIYTVAAVSFRTITISGQFPLAHAGFMGIGAYLSALMAKFWGWPPLFCVLLGALLTMVIGMLVGLRFSRLRSLYYAIGSLFLGIGVIYIIYAFPSTSGYTGMMGIPRLFQTADKMPYYYFFLVVALISIAALYRFEVSHIGTILKAISQSHLVASSIGINEAWYRVLVNGVGCFFVGFIGAGYAHYNMAMSPTAFDFMATLWLCMYVLIGGITSFAGPIIGTLVLFLLPEFARGLQEYSPYFSAFLLLIVIFFMPKGLVSLPVLLKSYYLKHREGEQISNVSGN
ncbi:MAG: branched-chain amino acid ABC transporter permease [Bacillota bacterium]|nr:branched-chain amino acid ABC transporter permease [Bacillota bacterium]